MITDLCDKHRAVLGSSDGPEFSRLVRTEMVRDEKFRRAIQEGKTEEFEPVCCHVGDSAVTDAKLGRVVADPSLDPAKLPKADKLVPKEPVSEEKTEG